MTTLLGRAGRRARRRALLAQRRRQGTITPPRLNNLQATLSTGVECACKACLGIPGLDVDRLKSEGKLLMRNSGFDRIESVGDISKLPKHFLFGPGVNEELERANDWIEIRVEGITVQLAGGEANHA